MPRLMEWPLLPLALLALLGGLLNLPPYLAVGGLDSFFATALRDGAGHLGHGEEVVLQGVAALIALAGLALAHRRYGGSRRALRLAAAEQAPSGLSAFLLHGWYLDDLYRRLFVGPFERLAGFLWRRLDEGCIDRSLDRFGEGLWLFGLRLGRWATGRVSVYLASFAAGTALILAWLAWGLFR